jgi:hypothetical protein
LRGLYRISRKGLIWGTGYGLGFSRSAVEPLQSLYELNPSASALRGEARRAARDSARMRFDVPEAAPTERLNRIIWRMVAGGTFPIRLSGVPSSRLSP